MSNGTGNKQHILTVANRVILQLLPFCDDIKIVGSIRRGCPIVNDVDIVLIPKVSHYEITINLATIGAKQSGGDKKETWLIDNVTVELYYATMETWGAFILMYTGSKAYNIYMRAKAKALGYTLNQYGLFEPTDSGTTILAQTESAIFKALGMEYVEPEKRY